MAGGWWLMRLAGEKPLESRPMRNIGIIIILIAVVWNIITTIIQHSQAKRQEEEAKRRARDQGSQAGQVSRSRTAQTQTAGTPSQRARLDDLAARRQAQLEELRQRRAEKSTGQQHQRQQRITRGAGGSEATARAEQTRQRDRLSGSERQRAVSQQRESQRYKDRESALRREQETYQQQQQALEIPRRQRPQRRREEPTPIEAAALGTAEEISRVEVEEVRKEVRRRIERIRTQLQNPGSLRDMIVMKELLDVPPGLRDMPA